MNNNYRNKTGVYKIVNKTNGKFYYGSVADQTFTRRWQKHIEQLNKNKHTNKHLQSAWNLYGSNNFDFVAVLLCNPENCLFYEQLFLDKYWDNCENCYNILPKAGNSLGYKHRQESKNKMSARALGHKRGVGKRHSEETKKKISLARKGINNQTPEQILKSADNRRGKKRSAETKAKISASLMGNKRWLGKTHSKETIEKIKIASQKRFNKDIE